MTHRQTATDANTPLINRRVERVFSYVDPLNIGKSQKHEFEIEVYDMIETESVAKAVFNDKIVEECSTHSDFYGLGTSFEKDVLKSAQRMMKTFAGTGISVVIEVRLLFQAVILAVDEESFSRNSVPVYHVPWSVFVERDGEAKSFENLSPDNGRVFQIWKDGFETEDSVVLQKILESAKEQDAVSGLRKK